MPADAPRILIVTAAFGEGHNSAARNLAAALTAAGAHSHVSDPCLIGAPRITSALSQLYRGITTYFPWLWAKIYRSTDRCDFSHHGKWLLRAPNHALVNLIGEFKPTAIVSTYPIYPYFLADFFGSTGKSLPVFTVVTDSIEINAAWLRAPSSYWLVTDPATREKMIHNGLPAGQVIDTGFPVHPEFGKLLPVDRNDACVPFRVLYFPTARSHLMVHHGRALLDASPAIHLTIVLGRNVRHLHRRAAALRHAYPGRVRLIGWTRRIPQLLNQHHLVIGKAGGATVHEAIAARCPMLIHHLVPGQEEGNLQLLKSIGAGGLATSPEALRAHVTDLLADRAGRWRTMKDALGRHGRNSGAVAAASFVLSRL